MQPWLKGVAEDSKWINMVTTDWHMCKFEAKQAGGWTA